MISTHTRNRGINVIWILLKPIQTFNELIDFKILFGFQMKLKRTILKVLKQVDMHQGKMFDIAYCIYIL